MTRPTKEKFLADANARYKEIGIRKNSNGHALRENVIRYRDAESGKDKSTEAKTALKEVNKFMNILKTYKLKRTTDFLYWEFAYQMHLLDSEKPEKKSHAIVQSDSESNNESDSESDSEDESESTPKTPKSKSASRSASRSPKSPKHRSKSASRSPKSPKPRSKSASRSPKSPKPRSKSALRSPKPKSLKSPQLVRSASRSASRSPLRPPVRSFSPSPRHPSPGPSKKKSIKKVAMKSGYKERYQPFMDNGVVSKGVWGPYPSPNYLRF